MLAKKERQIMDRKSMLIRQAQAIIAKREEGLDYRTKVLYNQVRSATRHMSDEELARALEKGLSG